MTFFGVLLFLPAGTLSWWRAWIFPGVVFAGTVASTVSVFCVSKSLLEERFKLPVQRGQPLADKIILVLFIAAFCGLMIFIPLDVFRFQVLPKPSTFVSASGLGLFIAGWCLITLAMTGNAYAVPVVKHQDDRHQHVIDRGIYSVVRHPMYAGAVLLLVGMPLWLESYVAAVLAIFPIGTLAVRSIAEERFLMRELPGYRDYAARVRCRMIPFVW